MKASEPKWVNSILNIIGVSSLRSGGRPMRLLKNQIDPFYAAIDGSSMLPFKKLY